MKMIETNNIGAVCVPGRSKSVGALVDDYKSAQSLGCTDLADDAVTGRVAFTDSQRFEASKSVRSFIRISN